MTKAATIQAVYVLVAAPPKAPVESIVHPGGLLARALANWTRVAVSSGSESPRQV